MPIPPRTLSIIIPALDEAALIAAAVRHARAFGLAEVIVADGGSLDATVEAAEEAGAKVVLARRGRAAQQNAGAAAAMGDTFVFLHADTRLPPGAMGRITEILADPGVSLGAFRLGFDRDDFGTRFLVFGADLRMRLFALPYGDQALFLRRESFERLGGFRDVPIMEDLCLVRRAKRFGRVVIAPERVQTSPRRYDRNGLLRNMLMNWVGASLFALGAPPERLVRFRR
jgi:rSAM/selenodomain-associated transferase 2